ncbi:MAG: DUF4342 domain-containing protein [Chloroflexi bacterium]|nr:MAG: DUF4342 domain-containing protein [Chloroflexota bacterium]
MAVYTEEFKINGEQLVGKVKGLIREGNVRRIIVKNREDKALVEFPLTIGLVGAVIAPALAAVGAVAALVTECTLVVERDDGRSPSETTTGIEPIKKSM